MIKDAIFQLGREEYWVAKWPRGGDLVVSSAEMVGYLLARNFVEGWRVVRGMRGFLARRDKTGCQLN